MPDLCRVSLIPVPSIARFMTGVHVVALLALVGCSNDAADSASMSADGATPNAFSAPPAETEALPDQPEIGFAPAPRTLDAPAASPLMSRMSQAPAPLRSASPAPRARLEPELEFAEVSEDNRSSLVRVFYGTNRRPSGDSFETSPNTAYSDERGPVEYGVCAVSIPNRHSYGQIERPSVWRFEFSENPKKHVMLRQIARVDETRFTRALQVVTGESKTKEAFVFVHGYNNDFAEAARRTAQIKHDLSFDGPAILFSWPSAGSATAYKSDRKQIAPTLPQLTNFLSLVAAQSGANRIHVVAHSMGNEFVTRSLAELSTTHHAEMFDELILAAPDIDATEFATVIAPYLRPACRRCTIYAADHDLALDASRRFHRKPRLGQAGRYLVSFPGTSYINVVDASAVGFDLFNLGHADFGDELLRDIRGVMSGLAPAGRKLKPHRITAAWRFIPGSVSTTSYETDPPARDLKPVSHALPAPKPPVEPTPEEPALGLWAAICSWWNG